MSWQPIETAPKSVSRPAPGGGHLVEGIYLLGFCPEEGARPEGCIEIIWWEPHEGPSGHWVTGISRCKPTHWMLLPTPPECGADDGASSRHTGQLRDEQNPHLPSPGGGEEFLEFKEALSDLRSLRHEYDCLNGGGPGWSERNAAAWKRADDLFADEDEAAYQRQQEDAHG